jgi:hypothetical protein
MSKKIKNSTPKQPHGSHIFKKMLDDKKAIAAHLKNGGTLTQLKDEYPFVNPISVKGN